MVNWENIYARIEDRVVPRLGLDVYERALYYHLVRHTRLESVESGTFGIASLAGRVGMSDWKVREVVRSLDAKGCIQIKARAARGHEIRVLLPDDMGDRLKIVIELTDFDIDSIDFFHGRKYVSALLAREGKKCFYCLRGITVDATVLDHVNARVATTDNSYRNIVACCHECNSSKRGSAAEEFVRELYRRGVLTSVEVEQRIGALSRLRAGELRPNVGAT